MLGRGYKINSKKFNTYRYFKHHFFFKPTIVENAAKGTNLLFVSRRQLDFDVDDDFFS